MSDSLTVWQSEYAVIPIILKIVKEVKIKSFLQHKSNSVEMWKKMKPAGQSNEEDTEKKKER